MNLNKISQQYLKSQVSGYVSSKMETEDLSQYVRLDLGENLLGCSPKAFKSLREMALFDFNYYADPYGKDLKKTIASLYNIALENIVLADSSNEIIEYLPKMIISPQEKVLIITPTFFRFIESSLSSGAEIIYQPLNEEDNFILTPSIIENIIYKINKLNIKMVWLCNPNNPTGVVTNINLIETLLKKTSAFVVYDEAFYEYYDTANLNSGIRLIKKYENFIVLRTLSKAYGLAGVRLGYAIAHKKTIETISRYQNTLLMTSGIIQKIANSAISDQNWLKNSVAQIKFLRDKLFAQIAKLTNLYLTANSNTSIFLLKHISKDIFVELKNQKILTADFRESTGLEGKRYVRVTIGNEKQNKQLIKALQKINFFYPSS
jgi:histidinol-phosphate aminotransferase